jgi:hypothetical protein
MTDTKRFSLIKPSPDTPFHIDFDWWKNHDHNWRVYLQSCLCMEHQAQFENTVGNIYIDWIDPETCEVLPVDGIEHALTTHCAKQVDFLTDHTTIVNSIFRIFLSNGNKPLTPAELSSITGKAATTILQTLTGNQVYRGIRPVQSKP